MSINDITFSTDILIYLGGVIVSLLVSLIPRSGKVISFFCLLSANIFIALFLYGNPAIHVAPSVSISEGGSGLSFLLVIANILILLLNGPKKTENINMSILSSFMIFGSFFLFGAKSFIMFYLAFEFISITSSAILVLSTQRDQIAITIKKQITSLIISAFFILGIALFWIGTGSLQFDNIIIKNNYPYYFSIALVFLVLCFRAGVFPFNFIVTEILVRTENRSVTSYILIVKTSMVFALVLLLQKMIQGCDAEVLSRFSDGIVLMLILSVAYGNIVGLAQKSLKKAMVTVGITNWGCVLPLLVFKNINESNLSGYLIMFASSLTVFMLVLDRLVQDRGDLKIQNINGIFHGNKVTTSILVLSMLSLTGFPLTAGFSARYLMVLDYIREQHYSLVICLLVSFAVGLAHCIKLMLKFLSDPTEIPSGITSKATSITRVDVVIMLLMIFVVIAGIYPRLLIP